MSENTQQRDKEWEDTLRRSALAEPSSVNERLGFTAFQVLTNESLSLYKYASRHVLWSVEKHALKHPKDFPGGMSDVLRNIAFMWKSVANVIDTCLVDRAITILADLRVPLQVTYMERVKFRTIDIPGTGYNQNIMAETIADAFVRDWVDEIVRQAIRNGGNELLACHHDKKAVKKFFLNFVKMWGRHYNEGFMPSQECINYCRAHLDSRWKYRKYGESVTSVFLEIFIREIAWARRYRYVVGLDEALSGTGMANVVLNKSHSPSSSLSAPISAPEIILNNFTKCYDSPVEEFGALSERTNEYLYYAGLTGFLDKTESLWSASLFAQIHSDNVSNETPHVTGEVREKLWDQATGIVASTFLENLKKSPDAIFFLMLQAFIESESCRTTYPLLPRHHIAYRKSVVGIAARRKKTPDYRDVCHMFGWFHIGHILLMREDVRSNLKDARILRIPSIPMKNSGFRRTPKYLGEKSRTSFLRKQDSLKQIAFSAVEMGGRMGIASLDMKAIEHNYYDGTNALLASPSVRASRHAFANKNRPLFSRMMSIKALRRPAVALQCMGKTEYQDFLSGLVSAETIHALTRAVRNEFLCGYSLVAPMNADRTESEVLAYRILAQRLRKEASLTFLHGTIGPNEFLNSRNKEIVTHMMNSNPWAKEISHDDDEEEIVQDGLQTSLNAQKMSFKRMMFLSRPVTQAPSQFMVRAGMQNEEVFKLWQLSIKNKQFTASQNFLLDYATFVSRIAMWSYSAYITMTDPSKFDNTKVQAVIPVPVNRGENVVRISKSKGQIICDTLQNGKSRDIVKMPLMTTSPLMDYIGLQSIL